MNLFSSSTAIPGRFKKLDSIHSEDIEVYTKAFKISPIKVLNVKAKELSLELRRNVLGLKFLYKLKSSTIYCRVLNYSRRRRRPEKK